MTPRIKEEPSNHQRQPGRPSFRQSLQAAAANIMVSWAYFALAPFLPNEFQKPAFLGLSVAFWAWVPVAMLINHCLQKYMGIK